MEYLILLGIIWILGLLIQSLYSLYLYRKISTKPQPFQQGICVLVAVRNESIKHLKKCIDYFLSQQNFNKLIICLTEDNDDYTKYLPLLDDLQTKDSRLEYTIFKGRSGYKGEQLNVAIDSIIETNQECVFGIFDIDSRTDPAVFNYVKQNEISVGQQFTLYDLNQNNLNILMLSGSLHQTFWSISFEMFNFFFPKNRLTYTIGHGLFINSNVFKKCGKFDTDCIAEDLMFGYKTSLFKQSFQVIPYFEHAQFAQSYISFIKQSSRWYAGELELLSRFSSWNVEGGKTVRDKLRFYTRVTELLWWPLERIVYIFCILGAILGLVNIQLAILYTVLLVAMGYVSSFSIIQNGKWSVRLLLAPFIVPMWHGVSVIGPIITIFKKLFGATVHWSVSEK